ncbi:MAG: terminase small subunit [Gammaproteobacteria bacterium]
MRRLTTKQRRFAEVYAGNGVEAARLAGYSGDANTLGQRANELVKNSNVMALIQQREAREIRPMVADRQTRQAFWTRIMADPEATYMARLRASELLARSEGDFVERVQHEGSASLPDKIEIVLVKPRRKVIDQEPEQLPDPRGI